jgi:AcrR family transcriptional regulator
MTLTLRQKKIAKTKHSLATAFVKKLRTDAFDRISIKDICEETDVSEATFYNYFPQKIDVIAYLLKAKIFKTYWTIKHQEKKLNFPQRIEKTFELFAEEIKHPNVFSEIFSLVGAHKAQMTQSISPEELQYLYPECIDAEKIPVIHLRDFFAELVAEADVQKELPKSVCKKTLVQFLMTILIGVPLSIPLSDFPNIAEIYRNHLSTLWKPFQP